MRYRDTLKILEEDLQLINEKYSIEEDKKGMRSVKHGADDNPGVSKMDFLPKKVLDQIASDREDENKNENSQDVVLDSHCEERNEVKLTKGYKANRSKSSREKLKKLISRYKKAKKTPGKSDDLAAIKARDNFEKTQVNTGQKSKYNYAEGINLQTKLNESDQRRLVSELIDAMADDLFERSKISKKVHNALKKKAKDRNAPLGALKAIYKKGMGAFYSSGSRSGQNPHSWAMGRVNSVLRGGKARSVDKAQWKQIQKHRKKKRKKKSKK